MILGGLALWLEEPAPASASTNPPGTPAIGAVSATSASGAAAADPTSDRPSRPWGVLSGYILATVLVGFFALNTHGPSRQAGPSPDLNAMIPTAPAGWDLVRTGDLFQFTPILKTENLIERTYVRRGATPPGAEPIQITVYMAYWSPGQVPVSLVATHTPDACWPGSGWLAQPIAPAPTPFLSNGRTLPAPEYRRFTNASSLQYVWYWHLYDGRSIAQNDPRSALTLLKIAWNYGFRTAGEQVFVRISSNHPWEEIRDDPLLAGIIAELKPMGL